MIREFSRRVLVNEEADTLHLVLGGSGMGKSSFLVALLRRYVMRHPWFRRNEIVLVDMGRGDCMSTLDAIKDKASTILLLDAIDENRDASLGFDSFIGRLEEKIKDFPVTVITCRTQFFPNEEKEPKDSGIVGLGKYKEHLHYNRYYVRYFSDWDVRLYLFKKYPLRPITLVKAIKAVSLCKSLEHRPLLLSYIEDVLKEPSLHLKSELDLYRNLIKYWIKREETSLQQAGFLDIKKLLNKFSMLLASKMYEDFNVKNDYYVTGEEADNILASLGITAHSITFKSRSLIERDAEGLYRFAHRTFLEFFLAQKAFLEDETPVVFDGLNMVKVFFDQMSLQHIREQENKNSIAFDKSDVLLHQKDLMIIRTLNNGIRLKSLLAMPQIKVLSFDYHSLATVLKYIDGTSVNYLRFCGYPTGRPLNEILDHPNIRYLWIEGGECSKAFIKRARLNGVSIMLNETLKLYFKNDDCPMDFLAYASLSNVTPSTSMILELLDTTD